MIKYIYSDLHLFGPHQITEFDLVHNYDPNAVLLGDIVDVANARIKDLPEVIDYVRRLHGIYHWRYLQGNHERNILDLNSNYSAIENGIYYCHGHYELWGYYVAYNNNRGKIGAGFVKRNFVMFTEFLRKIKPFSLSKRQLERIYETLEDHKCHTYIAGHGHPQHLIKRVYRGKTIYIVPRGRTIINL